MARDDTQDVLDLDAPRLEVLHEIADHGLGDIERDRRAHVLPRRVKPGDRAFEFATVLRQAHRQKVDDIARKRERRIGGALFAQTLFQHLETQLVVERDQLGDETALQTRPHPLVETLDLVRSPCRRDDDLLSAVEQRVDDVIEFLFRALALQELEIVDQQHMDVAEALFECERIGRAQRLDELIAEALGRQIQHLRARRPALHFPRNRLQKMAFAKSDGGMDVKRIVARGVRQNRLGNLRRTGMRHAV